MKRWTRGVMWAVAWAALAPLAACGEDAAVSSDACRSTGDCAVGQACVDERCVEGASANNAANNANNTDSPDNNSGRVDGDDNNAANNQDNNAPNNGMNNSSVNNSVNNSTNNATNNSNNATNNANNNPNNVNNNANNDPNNANNDPNNANNGVVCEDGGAPQRFFLDVDGDGYGVSDDALEACGASGSYRAVEAGDCDDNAAGRHPGASEVCDDADDDCDGEADEGVTNACGGCAGLDAAPGEECGTCAVGAWVCAGQDALRCEGEGGELNACGGCAPLNATPGASCGSCGVVQCQGSEATLCAEGPMNACGGCRTLAATPGASCGVCGRVACDGAEGTRCVEGAMNACGGCGTLPAQPGTACGGACGVRVCDGAEGVRCDEHPANACGGCAPLELTLGAVCGACGLGLVVCGADGAAVCSDEAGCPEGFARIEPGSFTMGSPESEPGRARGNEERAHAVTLTRPFMMMITEVTQQVWADVQGDNPSEHGGCPLCPVEAVAWWEAVAFANELSAIFGLEACYTLELGGAFFDEFNVVWSGLDCEGFRLPTEAEWEYAARAGTTTAFYSGGLQEAQDFFCTRDTTGNLGRIGWYCSNADDSHTAGGKAPNAWGLYDMSGNVAEWVWDSRSDYPSSTQVDPVGGGMQLRCEDTFGACQRVVRGGHFDAGAGRCRSAARDTQGGWATDGRTGLRLVRTIPTP